MEKEVGVKVKIRYQIDKEEQDSSLMNLYLGKKTNKNKTKTNKKTHRRFQVIISFVSRFVQNKSTSSLPQLTLQAVSICAGAGGRRGVLGSHDGGKGALLLDGCRHHVSWREGEDAGGAAAVGGQAGR